MAVSDVGGTRPFKKPFKSAAPMAAAALAIITAVAGGIYLVTQPGPGSTSADAPIVASAPPPSGGGMAGVQFDQATPGGVPGAQAGIEIVVKFKDDGKVKDIIDAFWKDQASARAKFEAFKARRPELANLKLDRVTYSNELVLVHEGGATPERRLAVMREIAAKLKSVADISYAEPNMTAHPGGQ
jgi:hypothetical protein